MAFTYASSEDGIWKNMSQLQPIELSNMIDSLRGGDIQQTFSFLDGVLVLSTEQLSDMRKVQALSLWMLQDMWDDLPYEITLQWENFGAYSREKTGLNDTTIINYIRAARVWYNPALELDRITLCDSQGHEVIDGLAGSILSIVPNPFDVPISKLILTATAYEEGRLTETEMGMVFNSEVSWNSIKEKLRDNKLLVDGTTIARFFLDGTQLIITQDGVSMAFGELYLYDDDPLVRKGIQHILIGAGIVRP